MAYTIYNCTAIQGGGARSLDTLSVSSLVTGDRAFCDVSGYFYFFEYDSTGTSAEQVTTHPYIIRPDDYATAGNWTEVQMQDVVSDDVYSASWNGDTAIAPSKNAVYDKLEAMASGNLTQISQTAIAASALSVSVQTPSGYTDLVLNINGMYGTANDGFSIYKNTTATADAHVDQLIVGEFKQNASANINCASIPAEQSAIMRMNYSAVDFTNFKMGTSQYGAAQGTITLLNASGATFQQIDADVHCLPVGGTAAATAGFSDGHHANTRAKAKSTTKMTAIVLVPAAGTFQGGTLTLLGRR